MKKYVITMIVDDNSGLLARVASLMCRKGFNIHSITASTTQNPRITRITIVVEGTEDNVEQVVSQSEKLQEVRKVFVHDSKDSLSRELLIVKIGFQQEDISNIRDFAKVYGAKIIDLKFRSMILELTGEENKIDAFIEIIKHYEVIELCRSGIISIERGGHTRFKEYL